MLKRCVNHTPSEGVQMDTGKKRSVNEASASDASIRVDQQGELYTMSVSYMKRDLDAGKL